MSRSLLFLLGTVLLIPAWARAEDPIPSAGRSVQLVHVLDETDWCLVALGGAGATADSTTPFPGASSPQENPMNVALSTVPGTGASPGLWVGLVNCEGWSSAYGVGAAAKYYNQNMATWWRPDTDGRLRSWVQPFACLDAPGGNTPPQQSYWLWDCEPGKAFSVNAFTYSAAEHTLQSDYDPSGDATPQCLVTDTTLSTWTGENGTVFQVYPVKLGDCTESAAQGWQIEETPWQIYPYAIYSELSERPAPFDVFVCAGAREDCDQGDSPWERTAVYHAETSGLSSSFTPFSMSESGGFPLTVKVYYKGGEASVDPSQPDSHSVMALDQSVITKVQGYAAAGSASPYLEFEVSSDAYITVLFTGAAAQPRLALFVDPRGEPFKDLSGCSRGGLCDPRSIGKRDEVQPFFVGPGFYDRATYNTEICAFIENLPHHYPGSSVDVVIEGGARLNCPLAAAFDPGTTGSEVHLQGRGVFDGNGLDGGFVEEGLTEPVPDLESSAPALVKACAESISIEGLILMNTQPRGVGSLAANSPWDCGAAPEVPNSFYYKDHSANVELSHVKQVAGHFVTGDGFDVGSNSYIHDSFIEANDDSIKMIGSNQRFENMTIWQNPVGWSIECGWGQAPPRSNIRVQDVDIHVINHHFDKYCCSDRNAPSYTCADQVSNPSYTCVTNGLSSYPPEAAACDDAIGKQAVIGCLNGVAGTGGSENWEDFSITRLTVRNPMKPSAGGAYNRIQRVFAVGITTAPYSTPECPTGVELNDFHLSGVMSLAPVPEASNARSRFYVNAAAAEGSGLTDSSMGQGGHPSDPFTVSSVYESCTDPIPGQTPVESGCDEAHELDKVCSSAAPGETGCFQVNGKYPDKIKAPEPSSGVLGVTGLISVWGLRRSFRRRNDPIRR